MASSNRDLAPEHKRCGGALEELRCVLELKLSHGPVQVDDAAGTRASDRELLDYIARHIQRPEDSQLDEEVCADLASVMRRFWQEERGVAALAALTEVETQLLTLRPVDHPSRVWTCGQLGISLPSARSHGRPSAPR